MKTNFYKYSLLTVVTISFILSACYYKSKVPLDKPRIKIDKKLLGKWKTNKYSKEYYDIKKMNKYVYKIDNYNWDRKKKVMVKKKEFLGHLVKVKSTMFLNMKQTKETDYKGILKPISSGSQTYMFYKITKSGSGFKADIVTDNIREKF
ncbi:hypothetical protein ACFL20_13165, partial [Spirochaetota bacterium]